MSIFLSEQEYRLSGAASVGVTLNQAFLREIKDDHLELRHLIQVARRKVASAESPRDLLEPLQVLCDDLETYFALEEFYGYFSQAAVSNPWISSAAEGLRSEHERLFTRLVRIIDRLEAIVYRETDDTLDVVQDAFERFACDFESHEQAEMDLMMRLCNEELGVGD